MTTQSMKQRTTATPQMMKAAQDQLRLFVQRGRERGVLSDEEIARYDGAAAEAPPDVESVTKWAQHFWRLRQMAVELVHRLSQGGPHDRHGTTWTPAAAKPIASPGIVRWPSQAREARDARRYRNRIDSLERENDRLRQMIRDLAQANAEHALLMTPGSWPTRRKAASIRQIYGDPLFDVKCARQRLYRVVCAANGLGLLSHRDVVVCRRLFLRSKSLQLSLRREDMHSLVDAMERATWHLESRIRAEVGDFREVSNG